MIRTQLQLDDDIYEALRKKAHEERKSMSAVTRDALRVSLFKHPKKKSKYDFSFANSGASGKSDTSENHDDALAEAFE